MGHLRFLEHLEWAEKHGCIDEVDAYVRALPETGITLQSEAVLRVDSGFHDIPMTSHAGTR